MKVVRLPDAWGLQAAYYSPVLAATARGIPGMRNAGGNLWVGPLDAVELLVKRLVEKLRAGAVDASLLKGARDVGELLTPVAAAGLRPYQNEAVAFLLDRKRAILADVMGLGKTCSALTAARALASKTLIVCPSYVRGVWWNASNGGEIKKWWSAVSDRVFLPKGVTGGICLIGLDAIVIHYDILYAWVDVLRNWGPRVVIFDEAHALMSDKSRRTIACREVSRDAEQVWGLTGTPLTNRPRDLWAVVDTISPGRFGNFFSYGLRYCDAHKEAVTPTKTVWKFDGASNLPELNERLSAFTLRRTVADVGLQLPPKTRQIVPIEVLAKARLMPDAGAKAMRESLSRAADAKIDPAVGLIREHIEAGHKVVCFTWRRSVAEHVVNTLREEGHAVGLIHGGVSTLRRGKTIEEAKVSGAGHVLAATIDSSSTGIDLSYADVCVFLELTWEPQELLQAEARLHRFGQLKPVLIQYIIASGTTDELIASKVVAKLDVYESVVGKTGESLGADLKGAPEDILEELYTMIEKGKKRRK